MKRIVILGGGTGGTLTANRLRKAYGLDEVSITVVDQNDATSTSRDCCSSPSGSPTPRTSFAPADVSSTTALTTGPRAVDQRRSRDTDRAPGGRARARL